LSPTSSTAERTAVRHREVRRHADGKIAAASGDSRWVAGEETRAWAHNFRRRLTPSCAASTTSSSTTRNLTARPNGVEAKRQPLRIVATPRPHATRREGPRGGGGTLIATTAASPETWRKEVEARG
jgi:riboflavin biosynthesis pyrimidine reductase